MSYYLLILIQETQKQMDLRQMYGPLFKFLLLPNRIDSLLFWGRVAATPPTSSPSKLLTRPYAYGNYNHSLFLITMASTNVSRMLRFSLGCLLNIKALVEAKKKIKHQYQAHLKGEYFPQLYLEFFLGCFWKSRTNWQTSGSSWVAPSRNKKIIRKLFSEWTQGITLL